MIVDLNEKEIEAVGDIIDGTIDSIIHFGDETPGENDELIAFWNGIRVKLGLDPIVPAE